MRSHTAPLATRLIAGTLIATQAACGGWSTAPLSPRDHITIADPGVVRVTTVDGTRLTLYGPAIRGDSLVGSRRAAAGSRNGEPAAVALDEILYLETHHGPSTLLVLGGITLALVAIAASTANSPEPERERSRSTTNDGYQLGSCPVIDSWDGTDWRIDSGTYSGAIAAGLARAETDNLEYAVPEDGILRLRVRTEPGETDHIDAVAVLAVTHPAGVRAVPDAHGRVHAVGPLAAPFRATDDRGRDARPQLAARDRWAWESVPTGRDTARLADLRSWLSLAFLRPAGATEARLVLDAVTTPWAAYLNRELIALNGSATGDWYRTMATSPLAAAAFTAARAREAWLTAQVLTRDGWVTQGRYSEAGGEVSREQVVSLDLSAVAGDTVVVRLESAPSFWLVDYAGMDFGPQSPMRVETFGPVRATAHDGRDVLPLLASADRVELVQETGSWVELTYRVVSPAGGERVSFLVRTTGWYRIHTRERGEPHTTLLTRLATEPMAISRLSTARLNDVLAQMEAGSR